MANQRFRVTATTPDALSNLKIRTVPAGGAIINAWVAAANVADTFSLSINSQDILPQGSLCNVEIAANVVDTARDQLVFNDVIPAGTLYMPVTLTGANLQALLTTRPLIPQG